MSKKVKPDTKEQHINMLEQLGDSDYKKIRNIEEKSASKNISKW